MTNYYNFKGTPLNNLISDISNISYAYNGVTNSINVTDMTSLKVLERPKLLNYSINNNDISTLSRAKNVIYNTAQTDTIIDTSGYTHFTAYIAGGSGGGGGAGGDAETNGGSNVPANTSYGGDGGEGGYVVLISDISINSQTLYVTVGSAGNGGPGGADDNSPGQNGSPGSPGNAGTLSYIKLGLTTICTANGGNGGIGGGGANSGGGNGTTGADGTPGTGVIISNYSPYGDISYNNSINYPYIDLSGGLGGDNNSTTPVTRAGLAGKNGYVRIYLKKE